ncbi:MAG: leucine-rich repeat protein [Acutalibacteraceae bacterium]
MYFKITKKLTAIILCVIMAFSVTNVAFAANAQETLTDGIFTYVLSDGEAEIIKCDVSAEGDVVIPSLVSGYPVTVICVKAFENCAGITSITVGENVRFMRNNPFPGCSSLVRFIVDDNNCFYSTDEYGVLFSKDKTVLIAYPGANSMEHYVIPDTVVKVNAVFDSCLNLKTLTVPESVKYKNNCEFENCPNLTDIYYGGLQRNWGNMDGGSWDVGDNVTVHFREPTALEEIQYQLLLAGSEIAPILYFGTYFIIGLPALPFVIIITILQKLGLVRIKP